MSSRAIFTEVRLGIMGGYIHAVTWQIVDTRQVALLLIFNVLQLESITNLKRLDYE